MIEAPGLGKSKLTRTGFIEGSAGACGACSAPIEVLQNRKRLQVQRKPKEQIEKMRQILRGHSAARIPRINAADVPIS